MNCTIGLILSVKIYMSLYYLVFFFNFYCDSLSIYRRYIPIDVYQ
jgi:hypothetical protein